MSDTTAIHTLVLPLMTKFNENSWLIGCLVLQPSQKLKSPIPHVISNQLIGNRNGPLSAPMFNRLLQPRCTCIINVIWIFLCNTAFIMLKNSSIPKSSMCSAKWYFSRDNLAELCPVFAPEILLAWFSLLYLQIPVNVGKTYRFNDIYLYQHAFHLCLPFAYIHTCMHCWEMQDGMVSYILRSV